MRKLLQRLAAIAALACVAAVPAFAQGEARAYPEKPVRIIVPFPPGATMDFVVRLIAQNLSEQWGKSVVVENRTGGAGVIGTDAGAKAPADGYTILAVANSFAANPTLRNDLPYNTDKDFAPITLIGSTPLVLVAHQSLPVANLAGLVDMAKQQPGTVPYGAAVGASPHMAMAWFESAAKVKLLFAPYRGQSQAQADLLAGQIKLVFGNLPDVLPQVRAGKLKALGISTARRSPLAPEIPTLAEQGYPGPEWDSWYGFLAPAGTPPEVISKFAEAVHAVLFKPETKAKLAGVGIVPVADTPAEFATFLRTTRENYAKIIKSANIHVE
ncbi:MAG TPA: tripartite tricarboxylate transporter substrate binding protein [Ramlibacter sp.]|uniref:tripartite tricarboxylate transporter substrate binding protein n=1 Tax=Ramlibacter sp. TaxID=1917967 RepID=UPI002C0A5871|nr:tripartite tricarboxylate transporter substrate binding protein [Ramlibacter sp.]HVZ43552.1 tripartite tricarboxylate transporter substrate binding protein [Ramlibacter sp.]